MAMTKRKKIVLLISLVVIVLTVAVAAYFLWPKKATQSTATQPQTTNQPEVASPTQIVATSADSAIASNDSVKAKQIYNDAVTNAPDNEQKGLLKLSEAKSFYGTQQYQSAIDAGLVAEGYLKDSTSLIDVVSTIGGIYEAMGDKPNAVIYYQKTIAVIDQTKNTDYPRQYYEDSVTRLGGKS